MTTPTLVAQSAGLTSVRFYTAGDPYHYTTDNRPIQDLNSNVSNVSLASDSGRRAALQNFLFKAIRFESLFGQTRYIEGLRVVQGTNKITIGVGSVYEYLNMTSVETRQVMKQSIFPASTDFATNTVSLTGGQSVIYTIEARFTDLSSSTSNSYPLYLPSDTLLHQSMLFGELQLQIVAGAAATTGSEAAPALTSGWFALYYVTVDGSAPTTQKTIQYPSTSTFNSWGLPLTTLALNNVTSTSVTLGDIPTTGFADAADQGASTSISLGNSTPVPPFNPYQTVKFKLDFTSTVASNNIVFRVKYAYIGSSEDLTSISYTTLTQDIIAAPGTANRLSSVILTNGRIPGWPSAASKARLHVVFERLGSSQSGTDTNTGNMRVVNLYAFQ